MTRHIVVAFRMPSAGMAPGPEGNYLARARSLCARGEALGGRLIAWSAALLAMAWDPDSIEEAVLLATSIPEETRTPERAWAGGIAEGELEALAPDGQRMALAWGHALLVAAALARVAKAGEVLVDGDLRALRAGQLSLVGARAATDAGSRVRGWRLDLQHPWKRSAEDAAGGPYDATDRYFVIPPQDGPAPVGVSVAPPATISIAPESLSIAPPAPLPPTRPVGASVAPPASEQPRSSALGDRVRKLATGEGATDAREALTELRRDRARLEGAPAAARCQASLALAMALSIAGRAEEALLEALDALARAREAQDGKAIGACRALLAKLYVTSGHADQAALLMRLDSLMPESYRPSIKPPSVKPEP